MVLVDVEIAIAHQLKIESAMPREQLQHVIEEANAGGNLVSAATFDGQCECDARFGRVALESRAALCCTSFEV